jgi:uncharacterized RDD family membrane protein YckC
MENFTNCIMKKKIKYNHMNKKFFNLLFFISLLFAVMGIFSEIFYYYQILNLESVADSEKVNQFLWIFQSIYVNIGFSGPILNIYNIIFYILLLFGALFFYFSKGKEVRLLRFFYAILLITKIISFFVFILHRFFFKNTFVQEQEVDMKYFFYLIVPLILILFHIFISYWVLTVTSINRKMKIKLKLNSENYEIVESKKIDRLIHLVIDSIIMVFVFFSITGAFVNYQFITKNEVIPSFLNNQFGAFLISLFIAFIYYPFFEGIFGATPGKFLTDSRVVNPKSEIPEISTIFVRTLCRQIPFNAISFFGKKGWHDTFSKSYVVKEENEKTYTIYIIMLFIFSFSFAIYWAFKDFNY